MKVTSERIPFLPAITETLRNSSSAGHCVAGNDVLQGRGNSVNRLELRKNVVANYPFESSRGFPAPKCCGRAVPISTRVPAAAGAGDTADQFPAISAKRPEPHPEKAGR
jgi:hypothetical protein